MHSLKVELPEPRRIKAKDVFLGYLLEYHVEEIMHLLKEPAINLDVAIQISFMPLMQHHVEVAEALLSKPDRLLPVLCSAVVQAQNNFLQMIQAQLEKGSLSEEEQAFMNTHALTLETVKALSVKEKVHPRLVGVPCPAETRVPRAADVGLLLCFSGTVVRATAPRLLRHTLVYTCDTCAYFINVEADHDQYYNASRPQHCSNPRVTCYSKSFSAAVLPDAAHTADYQEVKLQELTGSGGAGASSIPQSVWATLHRDLVDSCKPGDDVVVCGIVSRRWKPVTRDARPAIEVVIRANNVTVRNKQEGNAAIKPELEKEFEEFWKRHQHKPLVARDLILASVCPQIYGLYLVKLAVAVVLCGGVQRVDRGGSRVRGEPHLLLVGDPGTGKSQLLQWACSAGSRSVFTTGVGTTAAGLTVAAVREPGGDWGLEAGALVLADGGVCCIDEFSSVREADRAALHEAMEQQTISVAKAGMVCKLKSRCSVVAATNPKGRYDPTEPLNLNVGVASPLLSRFDLILVLLDTNNPSWDQLVSNYILSGGATALLPGGEKATQCLWKLDKMRAYFRYARRLQPRLSAAADAVLSRFYQLQRSTRGRDQSRTTIRLLESLVRLSQGHARLMLHSEVLLLDAVMAVGLWEATMGPSSGLEVHPRTGGQAALHAGFPIEPAASYRPLAANLLRRLHLEEELREELARLDEEDRLSSAEQLALILGANSSLETRMSTEQEPSLAFKAPGATGGPVSSVRAESGSLTDFGAATQARRPNYFCATQDSRRRDLIEELEEVAPRIQEKVRQSTVRSKNKKNVKRKESVTRIDKYLKKDKKSKRKKQSSGTQGKSKKDIFVLSSDSESNSGTSDSEIESSPAATRSSPLKDSLPIVSPINNGQIDKENKKLNSDANQNDSKPSLCSEILKHSVDTKIQRDLNSCKSAAAMTFKPSSRRDRAQEPTLESKNKETQKNSVASTSPLETANSLSKKILAKRKKFDESPFCVNTSIKRARTTKQSEGQPKCTKKVKCDSRGDIKSLVQSLDQTETHGQRPKNAKPKDSLSKKNRQIENDTQNEGSNVSEKNYCNSIEREVTCQNRDPLQLSFGCSEDVVGSTGAGNDRDSNNVSFHTNETENHCSRTPTNDVECGDSTAVQSAEFSNDRATNSGKREEASSLSQKARSFLKKYAFSSEKSSRKSESSTVASRGIMDDETNLSSTSGIGNELSSKAKHDHRFSPPCSVNDCSVDTSTALTNSSTNNFNGPDVMVDSIEAVDKSRKTFSTSSSCSTKPSCKTPSPIVSKLTRFAFAPRVAPDEEDKENSKNERQENLTDTLHLGIMSSTYGSSEKDEYVQKLVTPKSDSCLDDGVTSNDEFHATSEKTMAKVGSKGNSANKGTVSSQQADVNLEKADVSLEKANVSLEKADDQASRSRSLAKRLCFNLSARGGSGDAGRKNEGSLKKSFEKFASSQDLDDDFDF